MQFNNKIIRCVKINDIKNISDKDVRRLNNAYRFTRYNLYFYKIDGKLYHIKMQSIKGFINELLGRMINKYFELKTLKTEIIKNEYGKKYLITKNFIRGGHNYTNLNSGIFPNFTYNYYGEYSKLSELDNLNLIKYNMGSKIVETDREDLIKLKNDLKAMIVADYIMNQSDRAFRNFMFEYKDNHVYLMPLYDFEYSFNNNFFGKNVFQIDVMDESILCYIRKDEDFQKLLYKAMELDMENILEKLMSKYPIKLNKTEIKEYSKVIMSKQKEIKEYKLIR